MTKALLLAVCGLALASSRAGAATTPTDKQRESLQELLRVLPKSEPWEDWLKKSGALPPNFETLPSSPFLPDPLRFAHGKEVKRDTWPARRAELLALFQYYVTGSWPQTPGNTRVAEEKAHEESGSRIHQVVLEFGPAWAAKLHLELIVPTGQGPFPVFITQANHRDWALVAVSRGYLGCVYAGADAQDDTETWKTIWPEADWTRLTRRAWAASRCVDYLVTLPFVQTNHLGLAGHSRNGKTSLIAAAFDQRIGAVISSSSGAGGACSYRFFSETQFGEGIELITRRFPDWFHPRLRFFAGRENKLPIDQPELLACVAPRPCLISSALNDGVESLWAIEQTYHSVRRVYDLFDRGAELNLRYRPGGHETRAEDIEAYVDWLDTVFGRKTFPLPDCAIFPTYADWLKDNAGTVDPSAYPTNGLGDLLVTAGGEEVRNVEDWAKKRDPIRERVLWSLGQAPSFAETATQDRGAEPGHLATLLSRATLPAELAKQRVGFGNNLAGDLYFPTNADHGGRRLPVVIWLHPISVSHGYAPAYRRGEPPHLALAGLGCAVFAFDQIGNGSRLEEVRHFYQRYPEWSLLGKQIEDTLAAVESLRKVSFLDPQRIWLLGYGTGGMTALHAAALDERIAGVVSVAGFTPLRLDGVAKGTGGVARWSVWMPLQPRLGPFVGRETQIPYDYHEVLGLIAPRPALIFAPKIDYQATLKDVRTCVEEARKVYHLSGADARLRLEVLDDYNHLSPETQKIIFDQLRQAGSF